MSSQKKKTVGLKLALIGLILALLSVVMGIAFFLTPKTPTVIVLCLIIMFLCFIPIVWIVVWWFEKSIIWGAIVLIIIAAILTAFGNQVWPPKQLPEVQTKTTQMFSAEQAPIKERTETKINPEQPKHITETPNRIIQQVPTAKELAKEINKDTQRPWVDYSIKIINPLKYDNEGGTVSTYWNIGLEVTLRNTGNIPANDAQFKATLIPSVIGTGTAADLKKFCDYQLDMAKTFYSLKMPTISGEVVFPGNSIIKRIITGENMGGGDFNAAKKGKGYSGKLVLLSCVTYRSSFDNTYHLTAKAFTLFKRKNVLGRYPDISLDGERVSIEDLVLVPSPLGGDFAD